MLINKEIGYATKFLILSQNFFFFSPDNLELCSGSCYLLPAKQGCFDFPSNTC